MWGCQPVFCAKHGNYVLCSSLLSPRRLRENTTEVQWGVCHCCYTPTPVKCHLQTVTVGNTCRGFVIRPSVLSERIWACVFMHAHVCVICVFMCMCICICKCAYSRHAWTQNMCVYVWFCACLCGAEQEKASWNAPSFLFVQLHLLIPVGKMMAVSLHANSNA